MNCVIRGYLCERTGSHTIRDTAHNEKVTRRTNHARRNRLGKYYTGSALPLMGQMYMRLGRLIRDPLTANAVVFDDGIKRVAVISVDLCRLPDKTVRSLQQACASTGDIDAESILIAATHTHVAPCTTERLAGAPDPGFLDSLQTAVAQSVSRAMDDLEEVELFSGAGYLDQMGWNRRGMRRDGSCHMYWGSWKEDFVGSEAA